MKPYVAAYNKIERILLHHHENKQFCSAKKHYTSLEQELKKNAAFKNLHKGKRCFVLGNGPSTKEQDLSGLEKEYVFTVNQIARSPLFAGLKSNYHVWADPIFFSLSEDEENLQLVEAYKKINTDGNRPVCFLPIEAIEFVKKFGLDKELDLRYFYAHRRFGYDFSDDIDYADNAVSFGTVVQYALALAIYMGFNEIYLLGCDTTGIIGTIQNYLSMDVTTYVYDVGKQEDKRMRGLIKTYDMEHEFDGWATVLRQYKELYHYCEQRGIKLVNCSGKSIIDSLPKASLEEILG